MAEFLTLDSEGKAFTPDQVTLDSDGVEYFVSTFVLDSDGIPYSVLLVSKRNATMPRKGTIKNTTTKARFS